MSDLDHPAADASGQPPQLIELPEGSVANPRRIRVDAEGSVLPS